jgi:hypothetical protein
VDKPSQTIDFLTEQRDQDAALRFLTKAICCHGVPEQSPLTGAKCTLQPSGRTGFSVCGQHVRYILAGSEGLR